MVFITRLEEGCFEVPHDDPPVLQHHSRVFHEHDPEGFHEHDRFEHEVFHEGLAAEFAWHEHVGGSLVAVSGHNNSGNYNSNDNDSVEHVGVNVDLLGSVDVVDYEGSPAWIADSGASTHLVSEHLLSSGHVRVVSEDLVNVSCSLASGEQITLHRRVHLHVCFVLLNGQYITAELEALVAPGINHSLLSCGSLVRKGWRVEFFDNRMSVLHAGLGGCSLVELCTLFSRNIGWMYSRSLAVDVASANDDFSFAYMVGERQGGETVGRSWQCSMEATSQPSGSQPLDPAGPTCEACGVDLEEETLDEAETLFLEKKEAQSAVESQREQDATAGGTSAGTGIVRDGAQGQENAEAAGDQEDANSEDLALGDDGKGKVKDTQALASRPGPEPKPTGESTSASASVSQNDVWSRLGIPPPPPVPAKVVLTPREERSRSPLPRHKRKRRQGR